MLERLSVIALGIIMLGVGLMILSWMLLSNILLPDSSSNTVLVDQNSAAAQRGYALPGEGAPVTLVLGRPELSTVAFYTALVLLALALFFLLLGIKYLKLKAIFRFVIGGVVSGAFISPFLLFLPPAAFEAILAGIVLSSLIWIWVWSGKVTRGESHL